MEEEEKKENKVNIHCTEFEKSPSESDPDAENLKN